VILPNLAESTSAPADTFDVGLFDLDGVVYVGEHPVDHAVEAIAMSRERGMRPAFVTNNASRTPTEVAEHLVHLGVDCGPDDVVTSAQAGAHALRSLLIERGLGGDGPVLAIGGPGVALALEARELAVTRSADDMPIAVMQGFGPEISWADLREASIAVGRGAIWIATNPDTSIPTPRGRAPGNGAFLQAVTLATGRQPDLTAGKPFRPLLDESIERTGASRPLMIGDRLDTDIEAGTRAGVRSWLVMTGVTGVGEILWAPPHHRPDGLSFDLRGLLHPHDAVEVTADRVRCGPMEIHRRGSGDWEFAQGGEGRLNDPRHWAQAMRCACLAAWQGATTQDAADAFGGVQRALQLALDRQRSIG